MLAARENATWASESQKMTAIKLSPYSLGLSKWCSVVSTQVAVAHDPKDPQLVNHATLTFQPIGQSRYLYLSTNPWDSASAAVYNLGPLPWYLQLNLFSSDGPRNTAFSFSCVVSEWHHSYTRESDAAHSAAKGGRCRFLPPKNASSTIRAQQAA